MNDLAVIPLVGKRGGFAVIDADWFPTFSKFRWHMDSAGYPSTRLLSQTKVRMHRLVNQTPRGKSTDHINGFKLDNTRGNLRTCNQSQNMMNQVAQTKAKYSKFKGVCFSKRHAPFHKKWIAYISKDGVRKNLGLFATEIEAAKAYNAAAVEQFGEFARLNPLKLC